MSGSQNRELRKNSSAVFAALLFLLAFTLGPSALPGLSIDAVPSVLAAAIVNMACSAIAFLLACSIIALTLKIPRNVAFPLRPVGAQLLFPAVFCCLGVSAVGVYLSSFLQAILFAAFGRAPVMPDSSPPYGAPETVAYFVGVAFVPAVFEELLFRGAVLQSLRRFGDRFALVASSVLFACVHGNLVQGPNALLTGLALGYFTLRSGSVLLPIAMHFANNAVAAAVSISMLYLPPDLYRLLNFGIMPLYLGLGTLGVAMMHLWNNGFTLPSDTPLVPVGERYRCFFGSPWAAAFILLTGYLAIRNFA